MTRTFAILEVSPSTYREIAQKLKDAGYDHAFIDGDIDMHGIGLREKTPNPEPFNELKFQRGEADGRQGHPPAEATESYLRGYVKGISNRP